MKKMGKWLEIFVESINYILLSYALSNMAMLFQRNLLFILFYACEIWVTGNYWKKMCELTEKKILSAVLLAVCFVAHIGMIYWIGRVVGQVLPFQ